MKILLFSMLLLSGCAETRICEGGHVVCILQGDYTNLTFQTRNGTYFHADVINHSVATQEVGNNLVKGIGALGSAAAAAGVILK